MTPGTLLAVCIGISCLVSTIVIAAVMLSSWAGDDILIVKSTFEVNDE